MKNVQTGQADRKSRVIQSITVYNNGEQKKHFRTHNGLDFEVDGLEEQKTTLGSTPLSHEQESEAAVEQTH